jgi:hypothetical protein
LIGDHRELQVVAQLGSRRHVAQVQSKSHGP